MRRRGAYTAPRFRFFCGDNTMNLQHLERARDHSPNVPLLINAISKRVRELNMGARSLVKPDGPHMSNMNLALKEMAEGQLALEVGFSGPLDSTPSIFP